MHICTQMGEINLCRHCDKRELNKLKKVERERLVLALEACCPHKGTQIHTKKNTSGPALLCFVC